MSEITVFDDKLVARFVIVGALIGFIFGISEMVSGKGLGSLALDTVIYGVLGLIVFGATVPLIAWYKYFRVQKRMSVLEAVAMVAGGLCIGALVGGSLAWLSSKFNLIAALLGAATIFSTLSLPYYWVMERKVRKQLNVIDVSKE